MLLVILPELLSKLHIWYIKMYNAIYQGIVITIQAVVSVFDFFYFFLAQKEECCLGGK